MPAGPVSPSPSPSLLWTGVCQIASALECIARACLCLYFCFLDPLLLCFRCLVFLFFVFAFFSHTVCLIHCYFCLSSRYCIWKFVTLIWGSESQCPPPERILEISGTSSQSPGSLWSIREETISNWAPPWEGSPLTVLLVCVAQGPLDAWRVYRPSPAGGRRLQPVSQQLCRAPGLSPAHRIARSLWGGWL